MEVVTDRLLIVGVDPGTTTGIALFDLNGQFLLTESRKYFSRAEIIKFIFHYGSPVILASDINPAPKSIEKIASSFFARLYYPEKSFTRKEKNKIAKEFAQEFFNREGPWKNRHEKDALVAALRAFKSVRATINKIDQRLSRERLTKFKRFVEEKVFLEKENIGNSVKEIRNK